MYVRGGEALGTFFHFCYWCIVYNTNIIVYKSLDFFVPVTCINLKVLHPFLFYQCITGELFDKAEANI